MSALKGRGVPLGNHVPGPGYLLWIEAVFLLCPHAVQSSIRVLWGSAIYLLQKLLISSLPTILIAFFWQHDGAGQIVRNAIHLLFQTHSLALGNLRTSYQGGSIEADT